MVLSIKGAKVMGDILSQSEIDELLKALNTGELDVEKMQVVPEKKIKSHDFRRPSKFAKEHIKTLNMIHDNYARLVTNFLTGYLRTLVQVDVVTVEALTYNDFSSSVSNPVILSIVDFSPLAGSIVLEIDPSIAFALVDRILGGTGTSMDKVREFTEIELAIVERVVSQLLNIMKEPWENIIHLKPKLERIETNTQFAQIISPNEIIALITLSARIGETQGIMNICIPHMVIEPVIPKLSTRFWFSTAERAASKNAEKIIEQRIQTTKIPVKAILGSAIVTVEEILQLQAGDVLQLDTNINQDIDVLVGRLTKFKAKPGVKKNHVALKITEVLKREDEQFE